MLASGGNGTKTSTDGGIVRSGVTSMDEGVKSTSAAASGREATGSSSADGARVTSAAVGPVEESSKSVRAVLWSR